ncbi:hypothetical protein ACF0H5_013332 [Mactra antiquata]
MTPSTSLNIVDNDSVYLDGYINMNNSNDNWTWPYSDYPAIYVISMYHLYPIIIIGRVLHIVWYFTGIVGNVLSLRIWILPRMKRFNISALYLVGITVSDISYQKLHLLYYLKYFWGVASIGVAGVCQTWNMLYLVPQYTSQLFVLAFSTERYIAIFHPFKGERFSRYHRAPKIVAVLTVFSLVISTPQAYFWEVDSNGFCELRPGTDFMDQYSAWSVASETVLFLFIPFITLALNIMVLRETYQSIEKRKALATDIMSKNKLHRNIGQNCRPSTVTLLCISFSRILTQLPVSLTYAIQNWFQYGAEMPLEQMKHDPVWERFIHYWGLRVVIDTLGSSHHALSIFVFYYSTKQFRTELHSIISTVKSVILRRSEMPNAISLNVNSELRFTESTHRTNSWS